MSVEVSVGYGPDGTPVIADEIPASRDHFRVAVAAFEPDGIVLSVESDDRARCALVHIGPDHPVWWGVSLPIGREPGGGGQKLEMLDADGTWQEIGALSGVVGIDWDQVEGVEDIVVYGGARGGRGSSKTVALAVFLHASAESLAFDMPKLIESAPGSFTGKGRKAHKKFNRKMGGGW